VPALIQNFTCTVGGERFIFLICLQFVFKVDHPDADQTEEATRPGVHCSSPTYFMRLFSAGYCVRLLDLMQMVTYSYAGSLTRNLTKILSSFSFIQLNAPLDYSRLKLTLKFTLKFTLKCSYMFRLTNHHQGAYCCALLKL